MITLTIIILVVAILMVAQNYRKLNGYDIFRVKEGKHYFKRNGALLPWRIELSRKFVKFDAMFGEGCVYDSDFIENDIHKLYGITYGLLRRHHYNSLRIGWRYNSKISMIELFAYSYIKGKREITHLIDIPRYTIFSVIIAPYQNNEGERNVMVEIRDNESDFLTATVVKDVNASKIRWRLYPYFGGTVTAPHDMTIYIKQKDKL